MKKVLRFLTLAVLLAAPWGGYFNQVQAQQSLPYSYGFENNNLATDGWTTSNTSGLNDSEFGIHTSAYKTGSYGFRFSSYNDDGESTQYLISPELSAATGVVVQFYYKASSSYGEETFKVGYSTTDASPSSFTFGSEISTSNTSWTLSEEFNFPAGTKYVAIYYYSDYQYRLYVDDITFTAPASCAKPTALTATLTPGSGTIATLNWTAGGSETAWVLEYSTASDFTGAASVNVSGTPTANLTLLTAETQYYARVKADCGGGDLSDWSTTVTFTPTNAVPLTVNDGSTTNSYVPVYGYYADATQRSEFIIPAASLESMQYGTINSMKFYANYSFTSTGSFQVYLKEVDEDAFSGTTFYTADEATIVYTGTVTVSSTEGMTIAFSAPFVYEGGNLLVGFYEASGGNYSSSSSNAFYGVSATGASISMFSTNAATQKNFLPKTTFSYIPGAAPTCPRPTGLTLGAITASEAPLTWTAGGSETSWKVYLNGALVATVNTNSYNFTGLTANTDYTFGVAAVCGVDDESTIATVAGHTPCGTYAIPYSYGFEDLNDMDCWTVIDVPAHTTIDDGSSITSASARTGNNFFVFTYYDYPDVDPQYMTLISPELTGIANGLHVEFYYHTDGENSYPETFKVGYSTTNTDLSSFTWVNTVTDVVAADYQLFKANYPANTKYVAVQHLSDDMDYLVIDDFSFTEAPDCREPSSIIASNITTTSANLSWTAGGAEPAWDIYVTNDNSVVPNDGTTPTYNDVALNTNYPISGLSSATSYYVYVRSACDETTNSDWTMPASFNTECEAISLPYQYDFEDDALPVCWNTIGTSSGWITSSISTTSPQQGSKHFVIQTSNNATGTQYVVLPEVDANYSLDEYEITFYSKLAGYSSTGRTLAVGVMTDPTDASTFVQVDDAFTPTTSYERYKIRLNTYTGSGQYIAIKQVITSASYSADYTYIDNLEVNHIPSCIETTDPAVTNITNHTADLTWTGTSASYNIDYRTAAGISPELTEGFEGATSWAHIGNGTAATDNTANRVHGGTKSLKFSGATADNVIVLPATSDELNTMVISFWSLAESSSSSGSFDVGYVTDAADAATFTAVGTYAASAHTSYTHVENVDLSGAPAGARVAFRHRSGATYYYWWIDDVVIGTPVTAGEWQHATSTTETKQLTGLLASTLYEVKVQGDCSASGDGLSEWSNTVNFTTISGNAVPTGLAVNPATITSTSATASWTAVAGNTLHESYDIYYATADVMEVPVSPVAPNLISGITATSQAISGLHPETDYKVWVRDNCGADDYSAWSSPVAFTTAADCQTPDGLAATNVSSTSATITWNTYGQSEFNLRYKSGSDDWTVLSDVAQPYTLDGGALAANTAYQVQVQATCAADPENDWSTVLNFSTPCDAIDITAATPYIEDFEAPVTTAVYNTNTAADVVVPDCWLHYSDNADNKAKPHLIKSGASYNYSTGQVLYFYGSGNGYAALPMFSNDWSELQISFKWATESSSNGTLTLGYITDEDVNYNTFTEIKSYPASSASYQTLVQAEPVYLGGLPANATRLVFRWYYSGQWGANVDDVKVSLLTKDIAANQWYAIASPTHNSGVDMTVAGVDNLTSGTYDLLRYNETAGRWESQKAGVAPFNTLEQGRGYIYRRSTAATLTFVGQGNTGAINRSITHACSDLRIKGFNLVGNPYPLAYAPTRAFYTLLPNGMWTAHTASPSNKVAVGEGFFIYDNSNATYAFAEPSGAKGAPRSSAAAIAFTVSNDEYSDVAYATFDDGEGMPKMAHLNTEAPALSIPQGDRHYAIANLDENTERFPLHFVGTGEYTLTVSDMEDLGYLHLIDRATGRDIDLLATPEYSFVANGQADRFVVRLMPGMEENGDVIFVRLDGSRLIVDGEGELQVFDVMGRQLGGAQVSGTATLDRSSLGIVSAGVYVMRLDGNSQKIVVK